MEPSEIIDSLSNNDLSNILSAFADRAELLARVRQLPESSKFVRDYVAKRDADMKKMEELQHEKEQLKRQLQAKEEQIDDSDDGMSISSTELENEQQQQPADQQQDNSNEQARSIQPTSTAPEMQQANAPNIFDAIKQLVLADQLEKYVTKATSTSAFLPTSSSAPGVSSPPKIKQPKYLFTRTPSRYTPYQKLRMRAELKRNHTNESLTEFAKQIDLTYNQVYNWMNSRREKNS